ncbi:PLAT domain-containing protein 3-like [Salvia miltiorrhiza]|uniref:PLAT domain-containing protein 3-like n=1 Tax=Salvia miltiorrhiza TaxID=226208 RepID=UPI0025ACFE49|nr:PLAT domain-containing protein 3-like [Salvia miltiorrhiza]
MSSRRIFFTLALALLAVSPASSSDKCVYSLYVETGSVLKAGTDSKISITLSDSSKDSVWIPNLKEWGLMGRKYDYLERGSVDVFAGLAPCIGAPICRINVTSDGTGSHHGWLCNSVEVTSTGHRKGCSQSIFYVDQWLATDAPPYQLSAVLDGCGDFAARKTVSPFAVRRSVRSVSATAAK